MWRKFWQRTRARRAAGPRRPDRKGFSLVEIMMVLLILSVGVLPIAVIQHRARRAVGEAARQTQGIAVAQCPGLGGTYRNDRYRLS